MLPAIVLVSLMMAAAPAKATCRPMDYAVAIDIGHTRANPGAVSATGRQEFEFNRTLAHELIAELHRAGFDASFLINANGTVANLKERSSLARAGNAALLLSIHHDSVQLHYLSSWVVNGESQRYSDRFRGYSLFVSTHNAAYPESLAVAKLISRELRGRGLTPALHHAEPRPGENRPLLDAELGVYRFDDLVVLRTASMPAVLLEAGVIVHRGEERLLRQISYRQRIVQAVVKAVSAFCERAREQNGSIKPAGNVMESGP